MTYPGLVPATATALLLGFALQPMVLAGLNRAQVLDQPTARSSHSVAVPRGGGIAVVVALAAGLLLAPPARFFALGLLLFAAIGLAEDLRGVAVGPRFGLQLAAAAVTAATLLHNPLAIAVLAVWLVGFANAFNFMDGINGISALFAAVAAGAYALLGAGYGLPGLAIGGSVVAAASLTFLPWNAVRAKVFLGDVGSYGLGAVLAAMAAYALIRGVTPEAAVGPLAVYLADTGWTLARRIVQGEPWYRPHRTHVYQRLTDRGWSHLRVTLLVTALTATVALCAAAAAQANPLRRLSLDVIAAAILLWYLALPTLLSERQPLRAPVGTRAQAS